MRKTAYLFFVSLLALLLSQAGTGCGGGAPRFSSKWTIEVNPFTGGKKQVHYIHLIVSGNRFYMHRTDPFELSSLGLGQEGTITQECDIVYDGKSLWWFNRKTTYDIKGAGSELDEWSKSQQSIVSRFEPDSTVLDVIQFWKMPKGLPVEQTAKDTIMGRQVTVLTSRQRSPLGADVVMTFWVDPQKIILKRQDSTGGESQGKGTTDAIFGRQYICTEFTANPSIPKDRFSFKPGSTDNVEELKRYPFEI
jgi:outer membrane lipoprotein-sorting protein